MYFASKNQFRIMFRKLIKSDLSHLLDLKNQSWQQTHRLSLLNYDDQLKWFESLNSNPQNPNDLVLVACHRETEVIVGIFKLNNVDWINQTAEVGWDVFHDFRGNGFGKEIVKAGADFCFSALNLRRLTCEILKDNIASQKCALDAGFVIEGIKRDHVLKNSEYQDSIVYGLLKHDLKQRCSEP
jgi:RimJ/RimL family protein N-acetyltransferase